MRALITGAAGFVGRYLTQHCCDSGDEVVGIGRAAHDAAEPSRDLRFLAVELLDRRAVRGALDEVRPDVVYHLAAQSNVPASWSDPGGTLTNNIVGEANLLQSLVDLHRESTVVVSVGSSECYGR